MIFIPFFIPGSFLNMAYLVVIKHTYKAKFKNSLQIFDKITIKL